MVCATDKRKISKKQFEYELYQKHKKILECSPYDEYDYENNTSKRLYLYYVDNKHIGTWMKGKGWEFEY